MIMVNLWFVKIYPAIWTKKDDFEIGGVQTVNDSHLIRLASKTPQIHLRASGISLPSSGFEVRTVSRVKAPLFRQEKMMHRLTREKMICYCGTGVMELQL
jgi:hypothetical protein